MRGFEGLAVLLLAGASPLAAQPSPPPAAAARTADQRLKSLYDDYSARSTRDACYVQDAKGELKPLGCLPKVDPAAQASYADNQRNTLARLNAIPVEQLSPAEKVNAQVFRVVLEQALARDHFKTFQMPFTSDSNVRNWMKRPIALSRRPSSRPNRQLEPSQRPSPERRC